MPKLSRHFRFVCAMIWMCSLAGLLSPTLQAAGTSSSAGKYLKQIQTGNPKFVNIGRMSFGPAGILLVADPGAGAVVAIDTGDLGPVEKLKQRVDHIDDLVAGSMGAKSGGVKIADMAVNPLSGKIYLSVNRTRDNYYAILVVNADGRIDLLDLDNVKYVRVSLPEGELSKVRNITGVAFASDRILAAGQCSEEFGNKIYSLPLPLTHGASAAIYSAKTYHVAHGRWETKAPIQSFVPYEEDGKSYVVGAFACTPIAKFPLDDMQSGAKVVGESVVELGSGNRPLDMFTYESDGRRWLVTNTDRFHWEKKGGFGPSKYWGVRVDMNRLATDKINEKAVRRDIKTKTGPEGIEIVDALFGAVEVDKLNNNEIIVLRDADGKLNLELATLP